MDIMSAIMILVPLLAPMAASYGIDPIHLGIVFIVNLELGYLTPPMGLNLFVSSSLFEKSIGEVIKSVIPFMLLLAVALMMVTYIPTISLGPVRALHGQSMYIPFPSEGKSSSNHQNEEDDVDVKSGSSSPKPGSSPMTIQELMKLQNLDEDEDEDDESDDKVNNGETPQKISPLGKKPLTIQELMKLQNLDSDDEDDEDDEKSED